MFAFVLQQLPPPPPPGTLISGCSRSFVSAKVEYSPFPAELTVVVFDGAMPPLPTVMRYVVQVVTRYYWL